MRADSPFLTAFHSAPYSLLSRVDCCPLCPTCPLHSLLLLPVRNFVNFFAIRAGIGLKKCLKRAHPRFLNAFHSAPFSLLSRLRGLARSSIAMPGRSSGGPERGVDRGGQQGRNGRSGGGSAERGGGRVGRWPVQGAFAAPVPVVTALRAPPLACPQGDMDSADFFMLPGKRARTRRAGVWGGAGRSNRGVKTGGGGPNR